MKVGRNIGENVLTPPQKYLLLSFILKSFKTPIIQVLLIAAVVSLGLAFVENNFIETIGIFIAIFLATAIGFYFELDAAKKFEVLNTLEEEQMVKVRLQEKEKFTVCVYVCINRDRR